VTASFAHRCDTISHRNIDSTPACRFGFVKEKLRYYERSHMAKQLCVYILEVYRLMLEPELCRVHEIYLYDIVIDFNTGTDVCIIDKKTQEFVSLPKKKKTLI
jgi:hypothetical protein